MDGLKARLSFDAVAYDYDDEYLTIDTDTHTININNVSRLFGVQYDGNSKLIKFRIRNKLSDIQKMQDSIVYINWIDSRGVKGQSIAIDKTINNDICEFAWKVPFDALKNSGVLHFAMSAVVTKDGSSVIDQRWSTQIASVTTPDGIYIKSYTPSSEEEDRIAQIYNELSNMINKQVDKTNSLKEDIDNQKVVPMASISPYKMNLDDYDAVITSGKYLTGRYTDTHVPTMTEKSGYPYDVVDIKINHDNATITVPYDASQNIGQAFVLYTQGVQSNNATPDNVNKKQVGVIEVTSNSYTVNLNADPFVYDRVAFTVPKGRRNFYFSRTDEGEIGKLIDKKISISNEELISKNILIAPVNMFYSIGAISDSYTAGSALSSDGTTWQAVTDLSWIATMGKRAGIYWSNYGKGGATTKSYITDKLPDVLSGQAKDLYFIDLGINDYLQNITVGTINDIKENYLENGESYFGYYGSIITQVQAHAPKAKIVLVKIWTPGPEKIPYDKAIDEIANHFGLPVINPFDDVYFNSSLYLDNMVSGHPTAMGYASMGLAMERLFSRCVIKNPNYFKYATIG